MTVQMFDCSVRLTQQQATNVKKLGTTHVARYLSHNVKGLTAAEAAILKAAGLNIISVYETNPTYPGYFTVTQAYKDLMDAYELAKAVGQPEVNGNAIYFAADYDAQSKDFPAILAYFQTIKKQLTSYKVGAYGSYSVLNYLHANNAVDYYFQTYAWSGGLKCSFANLYQYQNETTYGGIAVDLDQVLTNDVGAWGQNVIKPASTTPATSAQPAPPKPVVKQIGVITVTTNTVIRKGSDASTGIVRATLKGEGFKTYGITRGWYEVSLPGGIPGYVSDNYVKFAPVK